MGGRQPVRIESLAGCGAMTGKLRSVPSGPHGLTECGRGEKQENKRSLKSHEFGSHFVVEAALGRD
jgi:hypothetical protein